MLTVESNGFTLINLSGQLLFGIFILIGAFVGWRRGVRAFLTVTLGSILAYVLFVDGAPQVWAYVNNLFTNLPRIFAILTGSDPTTTPPWNPLEVGINNPIPVWLRTVLFIVVVGLCWRFNQQPWYSAAVADPFSRMLGALAGALTAVIWVNAATTLWRQAGGNLGGIFLPVDAILGIFPDVSLWVLPFILGFILLLLLGMLLRVPTLVRP